MLKVIENEHTDGNGKTFRCGQIANEGTGIQGVGRKIFIRYEIHMNLNDTEIIFDFDLQ